MTKFTDVHMVTAINYSKLSSAKKLQCGAVLVTPDDKRILMIGYNGTPTGCNNVCEDYVCEECNTLNKTNICSNCGKTLTEMKTKDNVLHAEENCLIFCAKAGIKTEGCILYSTHLPCKNCAKLILGAGISKVYYRYPYRSTAGKEILDQNGIVVQQI